jgi:hypothetical protein
MKKLRFFLKKYQARFLLGLSYIVVVAGFVIPKVMRLGQTANLLTFGFTLALGLIWSGYSIYKQEMNESW